MTELQEVCRDIRKELQAADMYAYEAAKHQDQYADLAAKYYQAAKQHMGVADELMAGAERMVEDARRRGREGADQSGIMIAWEREMMLAEKECIARKLDMYKR